MYWCVRLVLMGVNAQMILIGALSLTMVLMVITGMVSLMLV